MPAPTATIDVSDGFFEQLRLGFSGTAIFVSYFE
jgi:hypothetical protein